MMSFWVIAPTPDAITFRRTSECSTLTSSETTASTEPTTSPRTIRFEVVDLARLKLRRRDPRGRLPWGVRVASCSRRSRSARRLASSRAWRSFSTTRASSPAAGGLSKPRISTGSPGPALSCFTPL